MWRALVDYPRTGKFGVLHEFAEADGKPQMFRFIGRADRGADYWEGEQVPITAARPPLSSPP